MGNGYFILISGIGALKHTPAHARKQAGRESFSGFLPAGIESTKNAYGTILSSKDVFWGSEDKNLLIIRLKDIREHVHLVGEIGLETGIMLVPVMRHGLDFSKHFLNASVLIDAIFAKTVTRPRDTEELAQGGLGSIIPRPT